MASGLSGSSHDVKGERNPSGGLSNLPAVHLFSKSSIEMEVVRGIGGGVGVGVAVGVALGVCVGEGV